MDWSGLRKHRELFDYVRRLIAFRKAHPVLRARDYDFSHNGTGYPQLSFHGTRAWDLNENGPGLCFAYMYAEDHARFSTPGDAFIYVAVNAHWEAHRFELPVVPAGFRWRVAFDSNGFSADVCAEIEHDDYSGIDLGPRSAAVLVAEAR